MARILTSAYCRTLLYIYVVNRIVTVYKTALIRFRCGARGSGLAYVWVRMIVGSLLDRVLDVLVPEVVLNQPGIRAAGSPGQNPRCVAACADGS
jgi:hypothetical protein